MLKGTYHPNAFLSSIKNIKRGLMARTQILFALEKGSADAAGIAMQAGLHPNVVRHHLKLLLKDGIVERRNARPQIWQITGVGQKRLVSSN
jgi:predicted ArsR family transcriptional regulator